MKEDMIMAFYDSPADMFLARAKRFKKQGDEFWARAKNGEGGGFYGKAKKCYAQATLNKAKAEEALKTGAKFLKGK